MLVTVVEGLMVLCLVSGLQAGRRFQDVMEFGRKSGSRDHGHHMHGWSPDTNSWDEKLYPAWRSGDARWEDCWRGGKVVALLTSDSPALIGSNVTFAVNLQFPRCQKENDDGDIVYERGCGNASSSFPEQYVYKWRDGCEEENCSLVNFPDGRPFPDHPRWRRHNFIYIFSTLGQYYQSLGRPSTVLSLNTTNITAGAQIMEVRVFRRGYPTNNPVAETSGVYIITDQIPFAVTITQNDKKLADNVFIKDLPIRFDAHINDPSHYLGRSEVTFDWDFGDKNGSSVSNNPVSLYAYSLLGHFPVNLTIKAAIPAPCKPVTPTPIPTTTHLPTTHLPTTTRTFITTNTTDNSTELPPWETETFPLTTTASHTTTLYTTPATGCFIYRYGYYKTEVTIVDGILDVDIVEMTSVQVSTSQNDHALVDFVVTCQGSLPTDACTVVSDDTCTIPQGMVCDEVPPSDQCLLTLRRTFAPGSYCVNITLSNGVTLAFASTLVSIDGGSRTQQDVSAVLVPVALVAIVAVVVGIALYKKYKQYKPFGNASYGRHGQGFAVHFSQIKDVFSRRNNEHHPLLKSQASII